MSNLPRPDTEVLTEEELAQVEEWLPGLHPITQSVVRAALHLPTPAATDDTPGGDK